MKSFLSSLRKLNSSTHVLVDRIVSHRQHQLFTTLLLSGAIIGSSLSIIATPATAAPARKDWCSTIWSVDNAGTTSNGTTRINPSTGAIETFPVAGITMPPFFPGTGSVAGLGIHAESGTLYAFNRTGTTGTLYKYKLGTDTTWQSVLISGLVGLSATPPQNLNKVTVDGNTLYIAESVGLDVYSIPLNSSGVVIGNATPAQYTFSGDPIGTPPHKAQFSHNLGGTDTTPTDPIGSTIMNGGDIAIDEYGDVYNITYNSVLTAWNLINNTWTATTVTDKAYFYKQSGTTWVYQGETSATAAFAGAAFYKGELYVKSATQLRKVPLVLSGSGYTGWNSTLSNVGPASTGFSSGDLAACGTPNITMTKTQQIYADAALTILVADQTKVKTGQYIKYKITAQNTGTSWARNTTITDALPPGTTYVPDSASLNGTSLGLTTYPTSGFVINAPGSTTGTVPYSTGVVGSDTATMSFAVQVNALNGSVTNQATVAYIDNSGLPSEPSSCTSPFLNCSITPPVSVTAVDFGDAPDGSAGIATGDYKTTEANNGPSHIITAGLKLGATAPDADNGLQQNAAADADGADEDAFTSLPNVPTTGTYSLTSVPVTNTTGSTATLRAWVDFNNNGSFEAGEFASATVANNATTANLSWTVPAGTVVGSTYARFRLTTQALTDTVGTSEDERSFGAASNGEVEDYPVSIIAAAPFPPISQCNSDVYTVNLPSAGGGFQKLNGFSSTGYTPTTLATTGVTATNVFNLAKAGDNNLYYATSDNNPGVSFVQKLNTTTNTSSPTTWQLPALSPSSTNGFNNSQANYWISAATDPSGMLYFVSRFGKELVKVNPYTNTVTPVWTEATLPQTTFQAPPIANPTATALNGAASKNFGFGFGVDIGFNADGDAFFIDNRAKYIWKVTNLNSTPTAQYLGTISGGATQYNDIVWHNNGSGVPQLYALGNNGINLLDPSTYAATPVPGANNYYDIAGCNIFGTLATPGIDNSDAPITGTAPSGTGTNAYGTAAHLVVAGMKLGTNIDAETTSISDATASGDGPDDDGISFPTLTPGATSYSIPAANITATGTGTLHAWIDFNKNGTFEAGEYKSVAVTNNVAGALNWTGITAGAAGNTFARFRFTNDTSITASTPSGSAINGEVEDYQVALAVSKANVIMVKRITAIKDSSTSNVTTYNSFVDDTTSPSKTNDNNCGWPGAVATAGVCTTNTYLKGEFNPTVKIKPGDEIEYTIYYLNSGGNKAKQARICDQLSSNLTFQGDTPTTPATTAPLNIQLFPGSAGPLESLTNSTTDADKGQLTTAALATSCNLAGNTGTNPSDNVVVVDVATPTNPLLGSTGAGIPTTSYGYIRIKTTVK